MTKRDTTYLTRREQQILDTVHRLGEATVAEVRDGLPESISYDAARGTLRLLRERGLVTYGHQGKRYVYRPAGPRQESQESALRHVVRTFFDGSRISTMAALLHADAASLTEEELRELTRLVEDAKADQRRRSK